MLYVATNLPERDGMKAEGCFRHKVSGVDESCGKIQSVDPNAYKRNGIVGAQLYSPNDPLKK